MGYTSDYLYTPKRRTSFVPVLTTNQQSQSLLYFGKDYFFERNYHANCNQTMYFISFDSDAGG